MDNVFRRIDERIHDIRRLLEDVENSRERSLAVTKLDEFEMWLRREEELYMWLGGTEG